MRTGTILFAQQQPEEPPKAAEKKDDAPGWTYALPYIMIAVMAYVLLIAPSRKERQRLQQMLNALKKNDEVETSAGILGIVTSVKENADEVTIKSDETKLRIRKTSIVKITNVKETPAGSGAAETGIQPAK